MSLKQLENWSQVYVVSNFYLMFLSVYFIPDMWQGPNPKSSNPLKSLEELFTSKSMFSLSLVLYLSPKQTQTYNIRKDLLNLIWIKLLYAWLLIVCYEQAWILLYFFRNWFDNKIYYIILGKWMWTTCCQDDCFREVFTLLGFSMTDDVSFLFELWTIATLYSFFCLLFLITTTTMTTMMTITNTPAADPPAIITRELSSCSFFGASTSPCVRLSFNVVLVVDSISSVKIMGESSKFSFTTIKTIVRIKLLQK